MNNFQFRKSNFNKQNMMNPKLIFIILSFFFFNSATIAQNPESILKAPDDWKIEIIPFPLSFAPEIKYDGFEDIRFAPGWSDIESEEFWTYHFTWLIENKTELNEQVLEEIFGLYYDGLAKAVLGEKIDTINFEKAMCLFVKTDTGFTGKIRTFDSFFTKEAIQLNIKVRESICENPYRHLVSFDISPKSFDHQVWKKFENVILTINCE